MKELLEAGVHFGHQTHRWNPKMKQFIYTERNGIHIIDLQKTVEFGTTAYIALKEIVASGGKVLFVGTKKQAQEAVRKEAERCGHYFVTHRWLGGMLTNWITIRNSIQRLKKIEKMEVDGTYESLTKKEILKLITHGMANAEIAQTLFLSEGTVRNYVSAILEKLEVEDRTQAAVLALRYGLVE